MAIFLITILQIFCDSVIQSFKILDFDRSYLITHFCLRIFFGYWITKNTNFQKILKKHHSGELHKEGTILLQTPQITLFLTHPV